MTDDDTQGLWVTDAEIIRRLGAPRDVTRIAIQAFDRDPRKSGFPQKQELWGHRRYWPAVKDFFDDRYGLKSRVSRRAANEQTEDRQRARA